jgi:Fe-S cluster biogenesis protein NfuA
MGEGVRAALKNLRTIGDRIEQLLEGLRGSTDPGTFSGIEELLRLFSELYGAGLSRVMELAEGLTDGGGGDLGAQLAGDELVASLLLVHGLHPDSPGNGARVAPQNLRTIGDRVEQLLQELRSGTDPRTFTGVEELLRLFSELYGAGLARIMELAQDGTDAGGSGLSDRLAEDDLVASLLLVHGLHPDSLESRVDKALAKVRPFLATHDGDVELLDIDPDAGALRLRLLGSCDGCPSSAITLQGAVETAILEAAPEIVIIDVDEPSKASNPPGGVPVGRGVAPVPISLSIKPKSTKPVYDECPVPMVVT